MSRRETNNRQQAFQQERADYDMSRESKFVRRRVGLASLGGSADWHYRSESLYYRDIEKARDMDRNDSVVGQAITRVVDNTIQDGFPLDAKTGDRYIDADLKAMWDEWTGSAENVDLEGEKTWNEIECHALRSVLVDGDHVVLPLTNGRLQMLEGHVIQTRGRKDNTVLGVQKNEHNRRIGYYVMRDPVDARSARKLDEEFIDARDANGNRQVFHLYHPKRTSQTRGVTAFAPIFATAGLYEDINFAKLVQQQAVSSFVFLRHKKFFPDGGTGPRSKGRSGASPTTTDPETRQPRPTNLEIGQVKQIGPGTELVVPENEQVEPFSPNIPNAEFFKHIRLMLQLIGVNLGLPLNLMLMDGSETNFSGWRGAFDEAKKGFKSNQRAVRGRLHKPVYEWKVRQWMEMDPALRAAAQLSGINIFGHEFGLPGWRYIEPLKDAQGDAFQIQNGLTSPRRSHAARGQDWNTVSDEIVEDNMVMIIKAKRAAMEINETLQDGQPVHWRELANMPMPNGLKMDVKDPKEIDTDQPGLTTVIEPDPQQLIGV